jgi:hypothetical protein
MTEIRPDSTSAGFEAYRSLRRELEEGVLRMASSIDGRTFELQASLHGLDLEVGGYVVVETGDGALLGQVLELGMAERDGPEIDLPSDGGRTARAQVRIRAATGNGVVLEGPRTPFHDGPLRRATPAEVAAWLERVAPDRARLPIGELSLAPGVGFALDAGGFGRHTFMCGQSGSGKTYSLGVMLEQLLLETELRIVVLDPNSDFVRLGELRPGVAGDVAERWRAAVAVHRGGAEGAERLRVRMGDLERATQAAVLRLDPVEDREEHAVLDEILETEGPPSIDALVAAKGDDRGGWGCARATSASTASASGRGRTPARPWTSQPAWRAAASSWTSALWRRVPSSPSPRRPCSTPCGAGASGASRC